VDMEAMEVADTVVGTRDQQPKPLQAPPTLNIACMIKKQKRNKPHISGKHLPTVATGRTACRSGNLATLNFLSDASTNTLQQMIGRREEGQVKD